MSEYQLRMLLDMDPWVARLPPLGRAPSPGEKARDQAGTVTPARVTQHNMSYQTLAIYHKEPGCGWFVDPGRTNPARAIFRPA
jgi:hypothetical protein